MIYYSSFDCPFGKMALAASDKGIVRLFFPEEYPFLEKLGKRFPNTKLEEKETTIIKQGKKELDLYFKGKLKEFSVPVDLQKVPPFYKRSLIAVSKIPYGETSSYGEIARKVKNPNAMRAVGSANANNPVPIIVPCHRVINQDGGLGGYGGRLDRKVWLLELENAL